MKGLPLAGLALCSALSACSPPPVPPEMTPQESGVDELLIGISAVDEHVVWMSGVGGTFARTTDGGATWQTGVVPGADSLQFRDVHGIDDRTAYLLSIGSGEESRIYKTTDAGQSWKIQFVNPEPAGFLDCMDFWDANSGIAFSDAVEGTFYLITTSNGGETWSRIPPENFPPALPGEGSFAASGTCIQTIGSQTAVVGTGAGGKARFLRTDDRGKTWRIVETPVVHEPSTAGLASVAFSDSRHGVVAGGDMASPDTRQNNIAVTEDGGETWNLATAPPFSGAIYGIAFAPGTPTPTLVAAGPRGLAVTLDMAHTWTLLDSLNYWTVGFAPNGDGWAAGMDGRIVHLHFPR
jgi:photosystem II stability/assembly factor-like uncharacterized protein